MFDTVGISDHFPGPAARSVGSKSPTGSSRAGWPSIRGEDDEPLGWMHENRHLRARLLARAEAGKNIWLMWKAKPA